MRYDEWQICQQAGAAVRDGIFNFYRRKRKKDRRPKPAPSSESPAPIPTPLKAKGPNRWPDELIGNFYRSKKTGLFAIRPHDSQEEQSKGASGDPMLGVIRSLQASKTDRSDISQLSQEQRSWLEKQASAGKVFKNLEELNAAFQSVRVNKAAHLSPSLWLTVA